MSKTAPAPEPVRYAFRSFDRQWALLDNRLCDRPRRDLLAAHGPKQVYITSFLTEVLGEGPSAVATDCIPDLHHFRGSFGGAHVIPLWRDAIGTEANITNGVLPVLAQLYHNEVTAEDLFAYCYAVLATPEYVRKFWLELENPGIRIPITTEWPLFIKAVDAGRRLLWLHSFGHRFVPAEKAGRIPSGRARVRVGTPPHPTDYPETFSYDGSSQELHVGKAVFSNVRPEVWEFSVSDWAVIPSWIGYRLRKRSGKKSSPLDEIRPSVWSMDADLLDLLWVVDLTIDMYPELKKLLDEILSGGTLLSSAFSKPAPRETKAKRRADKHPSLFDELDSTGDDER